MREAHSLQWAGAGGPSTSTALGPSGTARVSSTVRAGLELKPRCPTLPSPDRDLIEACRAAMGGEPFLYPRARCTPRTERSGESRAPAVPVPAEVEPFRDRLRSLM
jgi:hypothetical protein